jgi:hypothetical protein
MVYGINCCTTLRSCCCCWQTRPPPNSRVATVAYRDVVFVKQRQVNNNFQLGPHFGPLSLRNKPPGRLGKPTCPAGSEGWPAGCTLHAAFTQVEGGTGAKSSAGSAMLIVSRAARSKSSGGATCPRGRFNAAGAEVLNRLIHAAPMELTAVIGDRYYTHGAPAGA